MDIEFGEAVWKNGTGEVRVALEIEVGAGEEFIDCRTRTHTVQSASTNGNIQRHDSMIDLPITTASR